jgi:ABC-type uncharacterized transport system ATPase component
VPPNRHGAAEQPDQRAEEDAEHHDACVEVNRLDDVLVDQRLREINAAGTAIIMATHNMELIRRQETRTIEMARGQIVFDSAEPTAAPDGAL